jgi:hypothetical protein
MTTTGISGVEGFARAARERYAAPNEQNCFGSLLMLP